MTKAESRECIDEQAAHWAARGAFGSMTAQDEVEFATWLSAGILHEAAYLRARASLYMLEDAVLSTPSGDAADNDNILQPLVAARSHSRWFSRYAPAGLAVAACAAGLMMVGLPKSTTTGSPETITSRDTTLADGSSVKLDRDGVIAVAMADTARRITLQHGMATFHVSKDPKRPFIVQSGDVYAQATGTIYSVRRWGAAGGTVSVTEGSVLVWAKDAKDRAVMLHAGGTLTVDPVSFAARPRTSIPPVITSPGQREFSFDNVSIAVAAARFNAVNQTKIIITDAKIGNVPVEGLFQADQPEKFAKAAAAITGARIVPQKGRIVIEK